jgi:hypothetical protein
MIRKADGVRKYCTAHDRLLEPAIMNFFAREFSGMFGPMVSKNIASSLVNIFNELCPETTRLKPGQVLWNALSRNTRADSINRKYIPVVLTLVSDNDINLFEKQVPAKKIKQQIMARMILETNKQGGALSMRDLSLLLSTNASDLSRMRAEWEQEHNTILPHTGVVHDMGSTITHKVQIVVKHIIEKKAPNIVARETNHSQSAVDHYLRDYHRVKTLHKDRKDIEYIHLATNLSKSVINQYLKIINQYVKEPS